MKIIKYFTLLFSKKKNHKSQNSDQTNYSETHTDLTRIVDNKNDEHTLIMQQEMAKKSPASLMLLSGPQDLIGMSWPLINPITSIGRSHRLNDIPIKYNSLSKTHFQIIKDQSKFYIVDLKSTNKTYLNDNTIEPYKKIPVQDNCYIRASNLVFKFLDQGNIEFFSSMQMLNKTQTDPLTGAGNRELLKIKAVEYFHSKKQLSLIVFDIDNFKIINDTFGHLAGDFILKTLSAVLLEMIREEDMFIRYGGDEFCLFTLSSLSVASHIAERIRNTIITKNFIYNDQDISVDISIGTANKIPTDKNWKDIYQRADKFSYEQKQRKKTLKK